MIGPMGRFYVTTPIYYVNDLPHIGHIYTTTVADVIARWRRLEGDEVRFLTGTDEHGQNIERAARREGITPRALADRVVERYHALWRTFAMSHDDFIRTTDERHVRAVEAMVERLRANGDLYEAHHEGWYCSPCESFYTDKEIGEVRRCPTHDLPVEWKSEENVFFRLSRYQDRLLAWYAQEPCPVRPETRRNEVRTFVESGLRDLSVSRSTPWGIPFPGQPGQTVYVWLDALTNYIAALGFGADGELYERFWADAAATRLHLVGKDIVRFHAVYWPAFLMAAGLPLPTTVWAHGFWLRDDRKISKSAGNVVRPNELIERFGADPLRYFLLREMSFGADASFSDEGFISRYNSDLANDLGNTVSRLVTLSRSAFAGCTPPTPCDDNPLLEAAREAIPAYRAAMAEFAFHRALEALWQLLAPTGQYLVEREPWKLIKSEPGSERLSRILWNGLEATRLVATGLLPFLPQLAPKILQAIGAGAPPQQWRDGEGRDALAWGGLPTGAPLPEPAPLFPRIDKQAYLAEAAASASSPAGANSTASSPSSPSSSSSSSSAAEPQPVPSAMTSTDPTPAPAPTAPAPPPELRPTIAIDQFAAVDLRVATVRAAERVPKSNKLLRLTLDAGEAAPRTVVAGIGKKYSPEELVGRQVIVVANLAPATLMGVESNGMVLAADGGEGPVVLAPSAPVANGTRVR
jgi:methionyl-tRNA synthetase